MSRSAAVAYDRKVMLPPLDEPADPWPGRGDSGAYRLLGDSGKPFAVPVSSEQRAVGSGRAHADTAGMGYNQGPVDMAGVYVTGYEQSAAVPARRHVSPRLLLGFGLALVLAVALVLAGPVWARVPSRANASNLVVSRYSEPGASQVSITGEVPAIDVSAGGQPSQEAPTPAAASAGSYSLVAAPSISVQQIEAVLQKYGSPAAGQGQVLYGLGVKYGIDPAFALAFFVHESACGTRGVARYTHSLGNIRWTDGFDNYQGYRSYSTWQDGMEDWYKLITDLYINGWGLRTVDQIVPVYAPTADGNSPQSYAASVKWLVDSWRGK